MSSMVVLIWQGEQIVSPLEPISRVSRDYLVSTNRIYNFHLTIQGRNFGRILEPYFFTEKRELTKIMDIYDVTDPYGESMWWGAGGDKFMVQIKSNIVRPVSKIWDILRDVFTALLPNEIVTFGETYEGPTISRQRVEKNRGMSWWEKIGDFFHNLGIEVAENQAWIKGGIILGGVTLSLYFLSTIAKKIPKITMGSSNE